MPVIIVAIVVLAILLAAALAIRSRLTGGNFWPWLAAPMRSHDYIGSVRQIEDEITEAAGDKPPKDLAP